jgi:hypothetical protein
MSMRTKNDLTSPFNDIHGCEDRSFSFVIKPRRCERLPHDHSQERINFRSTSTRERVNNRREQETSNEVLPLYAPNAWAAASAAQENNTSWSITFLAMYITITFVRM